MNRHPTERGPFCPPFLPPTEEDQQALYDLIATSEREPGYLSTWDLYEIVPGDCFSGGFENPPENNSPIRLEVYDADGEELLAQSEYLLPGDKSRKLRIVTPLLPGVYPSVVSIHRLVPGTFQPQEILRFPVRFSVPTVS